MRVLVVGSGAREHAITWMFSRSKRLAGLYVAPGNAGTAEIATNLPELDLADASGIVRACRDNRVDLVFVGPEAPLAAGLVDALAAEQIDVIGPHREAARLESSKTFAKEFMRRHGIPTASADRFSEASALRDALLSTTGRRVIKQDGLAAGKGVLASDDPGLLADFGVRALESGSVLLEEFLEGWELSVFVLMDGSDYLLLPPCADFKKARDGETGPNTGGMGSICPVPWVEPMVLNQIENRIVIPTLEGMKKEGLSYKGVLYFGLMITKEGPRALEYNVRFGDPETQALLPVIRSDFCNIAEAIVRKGLMRLPLRLNELSAAAIVVAAPGYPDSYPKGLPVDSVPPEEEGRHLVFHAGTTRDPEGTLRTGGGRCFTVVGLGRDMLQATEHAYAAAPLIRFEGAWYRSDIGQKIFLDETR